MADTEKRIGSRREPGTGESERRVYAAPRLEVLGEWKALTLQQSVPIGSGSLLRSLAPRGGLD